MNDTAPVSNNFIRQIVLDDAASGKHQGRVATRFPPEPNGYLHIGHAKSICLNFGIAQEFGGRCNLRFDDTNPGKEDVEYVASIQEDVRWLGFEWNELRHASDYFEVFFLCAEKLIADGRAFVCDLSADEVRAYRGTLTEAGRNSPFRDRPVAENLELFRRMRAGEFADGAHTLRARIDMASGNINLRDPTIYRIRKISHQNTGDAWPIYPMYDYAHCISDAVEGITHSLCTLEFEDHRPLYDWYLEQIDLQANPQLWQSLVDAGLKSAVSKPQQIEFSRLNLDYTVMSKRKLLQLVQEKLVDGWDDPRMPTLSGIRRRGYPAAALRELCRRVGVTKQESTIELSVLEGCVRDVLDATAPRRMAVVRPLKLIITNLPDEHDEQLLFPNHPKDESLGTRSVPFSNQLWIEADDFMAVAPKDFFRLTPGAEVRLRGAGIIRCVEAISAADGSIDHLRCTLDAETRHGLPGASRKVKGTIHWVSARHAVGAEFRLYDRLFTLPAPDVDSDGRSYKDFINAASREIVNGYLEPSAATAVAEQRFQFERLGYFVADRHHHAGGRVVFNRAVTLRDSWAKAAGK